MNINCQDDKLPSFKLRFDLGQDIDSIPLLSMYLYWYSILHILVEWFIILKIFINLLTYNINNLEKNIYSCFKTSKIAFGAYSQKQKNTSQNRFNVHGWLLVEGNENFLDYHGRFILDGFIQQSWTNFLRPWKWKEWIITEHVGWDLCWI